MKKNNESIHGGTPNPGALPLTVPISSVRIETSDVKTFFFRIEDYRFNSVMPGMFVMIWIPGVDEIPMSVAYSNENILGITVRKVGGATAALHSMKSGDFIGIRGPFGRPFKVDGRFPIIIAGGIGLAPLRGIVERLEAEKRDYMLMVGARNKEEIIYREELSALSRPPIICTDDGSEGYPGFVTDYFSENLDRILNGRSSAEICVYTCGPEIMMRKVFDICRSNNIDIQASLERMMRCGFGLCGLCVLDPLGVRVCTDGPVFGGSILEKLSDFGRYSYDAAGRKIPL